MRLGSFHFYVCHLTAKPLHLSLSSQSSSSSVPSHVLSFCDICTCCFHLEVLLLGHFPFSFSVPDLLDSRSVILKECPYYLYALFNLFFSVLIFKFSDFSFTICYSLSPGFPSSLLKNIILAAVHVFICVCVHVQVSAPYGRVTIFYKQIFPVSSVSCFQSISSLMGDIFLHILFFLYFFSFPFVTALLPKYLKLPTFFIS
jgi:hypothetical protein